MSHYSGLGANGQLGTGDSRSYFRPVCIMDEPPIVAVSAGGESYKVASEFDADGAWGDLICGARESSSGSA